MSRTFLNDYLPIVINDTIIALSGSILLFILPSTENRPLLIWEDLNRLPWGILFLFGGGMALAAILAEANIRSEEHTSELQSRPHLVCRLLLEKKNCSIESAGDV